MQAIPRWRSLLILKNLVIQSTAIPSISKTQLTGLHSTRVSHEKWKDKWTPDARSSQKPSKDYTTYKIRQKRADTRKALRNLLFNCGSSNILFEETYAETETSQDVDEEDPLINKDRSKSSHATRRAATAHHKRMKRKSRREKLRENFQENIFQSSFGKRGGTWSFWSLQEPFYQRSRPAFEFKERPNWSNKRHRESDMESEGESDTEPCAYGTNSEREVLGLPLKGPLNIEDVKNAFRSSALKWHPDKHQGPSQALAGEKFKLCVDAYKSLCNSLSTS